MPKFKITYSEGDTINKTAEVEAASAVIAVVNFTMSHPNASDIKSVVEVMPE